MIRKDGKRFKIKMLKDVVRCGAFHAIFANIIELELLLFGSSSVPVSSTSLEMELVPFQFQQNWN